MGRGVEAKYLRLFSKIDKISNSRYDIHKIIRRVYQEIGKVLDIKNFYVALFDHEDKTISFELFIENRKEKRASPKKYSADLISYIMNSKKLLHIKGSFGKFCKRKKIKRSRGAKSPQSWLGAPMIYRNIAKGVVYVQDFSHANFYSCYDEMLLSASASRFAIILENEQLQNVVGSLSFVDPVTKIANRRYCDLVSEREMARAIGFSRPLSIALIRIANFKKIKDKCGTVITNRLLRNVVRFIKKDIRDTDFIARYTNEEFMLLLPETHDAGALTVSERIRSSVENARISIKGFGKKKITISIGVVTYPASAETMAQLVESGYDALHQARRLGRGQIASI